jgi:membrane-bound serine protease (ClpP class)
MSIWICVVLLLIGFLAVFLELFVPAGGLIGLGGFVCMIVAVVFAYKDHGSVAGTIMMILTVIGMPAVILGALKLFPRTFVGKRLILRETQQQETGYTSYSSEKYAGLLNAEGITVTTLRPSGMARIGNEKYSVVTDGEMIQSGTKIKVIAVEGSRIVVSAAAPPEEQAT